MQFSYQMWMSEVLVAIMKKAELFSVFSKKAQGSKHHWLESEVMAS
jgi:hypothetical protein